MGGPCWIVRPNGGRLPGPSCTDNFAVCPFTYNDKVWQSVEQCYQAAKFTKDELVEAIRLTLKEPSESDCDYGNRVWSLGNASKSSIRPDWDKVKIRTMLDINLAKYRCNPALVDELMCCTATLRIVGQASTGWTHPTLGPQNWSSWNGLIQMIVREEMREQRREELLAEMMAEIEAYEASYAH